MSKKKTLKKPVKIIGGVAVIAICAVLTVVMLNPKKTADEPVQQEQTVEDKEAGLLPFIDLEPDPIQDEDTSGGETASEPVSEPADQASETAQPAQNEAQPSQDGETAAAEQPETPAENNEVPAEPGEETSGEDSGSQSGQTDSDEIEIGSDGSVMLPWIPLD